MFDATSNKGFTGDNWMDISDDLDGAPTTKAKVKEFVEVCFKCGGSGRYNAPSSLGHQQCLQCKGTGKLVYKTSKLQREKARKSAADRKEKQTADNLTNFEAANPDIAAWWTGSTFDFAMSLRESVQKFGKLTDNQLAAAQRCVAKFNEAKAKRAAAVANAQDVNVGAVETAFQRGMESGVKRPKIRLLSGELSFVLSRAPDHGRNAGSLYVIAEGDNYLGKITEGKFVKSRDCSDKDEAGVIAACADPLNSAVAYGKRFGICSCCGRELSNQESIDLGIGPICRAKYF